MVSRMRRAETCAWVTFEAHQHKSARTRAAAPVFDAVVTATIDSSAPTLHTYGLSFEAVVYN